MIKKMRKLTVIALIALTFCAFSAKAFAADETLQNTLKDSIYGGLIGALVGSAVVLVSDHPGDHLDYIATGAGVGILGGAAYGIATSGVVQSVGEVDHGKFTFNVPTVKRVSLFDDKTQTKEVISEVDLLRVRF